MEYEKFFAPVSIVAGVITVYLFLTRNNQSPDTVNVQPNLSGSGITPALTQSGVVQPFNFPDVSYSTTLASPVLLPQNAGANDSTGNTGNLNVGGNTFFAYNRSNTPGEQFSKARSNAVAATTKQDDCGCGCGGASKSKAKCQSSTGLSQDLAPSKSFALAQPSNRKAMLVMADRLANYQQFNTYAFPTLQTPPQNGAL
jgi:hypothetical protein